MRWKFTTMGVVLIALVAGCSLFRQPQRAPQRATPRTPATFAPDSDAISVTWIGHSTVLIRLRDRWFLTDPVFGKRIAWIYPRRVEAGIDVLDLPLLEAVVISHAHFDHLDLPSLRRLGSVPVIAVPSGAAEFLPDDLPARAIAALATWERWSHDGVTVTAVPALHGHGRYLVDRWNHDTFAGWVIEYQGLTVYFAGDTGYSLAQAAELERRFDIDVAMIPVGPTGRAHWITRWRRDVHVTPDDAMTLFEACGAQWMVPIHFGTFFQPAGMERPIIERAVARHPLARWVRILDVGETTEFLY